MGAYIAWECGLTAREEAFVSGSLSRLRGAERAVPTVPPDCQHPLAAPQLCTALPALIFVAMTRRWFIFCPSDKDSVLCGCQLVMMNKKRKIYCWCTVLTFSAERLGKVCGKDGRLCQPQPLGVAGGFALPIPVSIGVMQKHCRYSRQPCKLRACCG